MKSQLSKGLTLLAAAALVFSAAPAFAAGSCVRDAKRDAKDCSATCKEDFQTAKDACLNRDHACVEVCRADRSQCRLDSGIDGLIDACNDSLEARRTQCLTDPDPDHCIDLAQIDAFECRDKARELTKPLLKQCRKDFRDCARACPAPNPATPVDPKACIADAKAVAKTCAATCKEDYQVAKDDCHKRDHACVESCRGDRTTCRQPTRTQLDSALAVCADVRQHGIHNQPGTPDQDGIDDCVARYPEPRDEQAMVLFDQCVDAVQVQAFICRDDAHEAAQPGFANCQQLFRSCVVTNCPVLP